MERAGPVGGSAASPTGGLPGWVRVPRAGTGAETTPPRRPLPDRAHQGWREPRRRRRGGRGGRRRGRPQDPLTCPPNLPLRAPRCGSGQVPSGNLGTEPEKLVFGAGPAPCSYLGRAGRLPPWSPGAAQGSGQEGGWCKSRCANVRGCGVGAGTVTTTALGHPPPVYGVPQGSPDLCSPRIPSMGGLPAKVPPAPEQRQNLTSAGAGHRGAEEELEEEEGHPKTWSWWWGGVVGAQPCSGAGWGKQRGEAAAGHFP